MQVPSQIKADFIQLVTLCWYRGSWGMELGSRDEMSSHRVHCLCRSKIVSESNLGLDQVSFLD